MSEVAEEPTKWNGYYQRAWLKRKKIMSSIINSGEHDPLRVINLLSSILRLSKRMRGTPKELESECDFNFDINNYRSDVVEVIRNVTKTKGSSEVIVAYQDMLPSGAPVDALRVHRGKSHVSSSYASCDKMDFIADYCRSNKFDAVIELGSGYCQNLVRLFYKGGPKVPYYGGEFTESGTECAKLLSGLCMDFELIPFRFDFRKPDLSIVPSYNNVLVFTCHAIEQVNSIPNLLLPVIAGLAKQVTCIHLEPFGFQMVSTESEDELVKEHRDYFHENNWNVNLVSQLVSLNRVKTVDLQYLGRNVMGGDDVRNPTSIALWTSDNRV